MKLLLILVVILSIIGMVYLIFKHFMKLRYSIKSIIPNQQYIIQSSLPFQSSYIIDQSDINYYKRIFLDERPLVQNDNQLLNDPRNYQFDNFDNYLVDEIVKPNKESVLNKRDQQNVHDTEVQKVIKEEYKKISDQTHTNRGNMINEIINHNPQRSNEIRDIISKINERNSTVYNLNRENEVTVLCKTWDSANELVKDDIINALLDSKKGEQEIYCPTGVVSRIVESTLIENPEKMPKPRSLYKEEMLAKASLLKDKNPDMNKDQFKSLLLDTYQQDYNGVLNKDEIHTHTKDWIDYID